MLQSREPLIEVCEVLAEKEALKVTCTLAAKDALITGMGAFAGALLAGPIGVAIGGTVASIATAVNSRGKYRSVVDILRNDLTPAQQKKLTNAVQKAISSIDIQDAASLLSIVLTSATLKEAILKELASFLLKELNLSMIRLFMLQYDQEYVQICEVLAESEHLTATYTLALKDAAYVTMGAFVGGLVAGPLGLAIFGSLTAVSRAIISRGKYSSAVDILRYHLTLDQKRRLAALIQNAVRHISVEDATDLVAAVVTSPALRETILRQLILFFKTELEIALV